MTTTSSTGAERGWDRAVFRCGRCGAVRAVIAEDDYLATVGAHRDAHAVWDRLNLIERDGLVSILRTILSAPDLALELLALSQRHPVTYPPTSEQEASR
ncbi:hypothetical protein [Streptomyces sp. 8L]|uniref:hypothetical protein n=1 Tax=Streptomyces sp. 8L TaxID=2877242 RepID=UPI001CD58EE8|nr:hypothetical protein [Streptomyces sp. 8L]MCA1219281.1 hypothetical protein [Streptomyces sp. 8L]